MELDGSSWWFRSDLTSLPLAPPLLRGLGGGGGGGGRMVDEHGAVPGGEHVEEETSGGGAITEVGILKSLVSGMSDAEEVVDTVDIVGCIPMSAAPRNE
jgi:hypothetical protein